MILNKEETNLLALTKTNNENTSIINEINEYENKSGITVPPIFKAFIVNFDIWSINEFSMFQVALPNTTSYTNFDEGDFKNNPEIGIESILKPSEYLDAKQNVYDDTEDEELVTDKIIIGNIFGGCLLLGYEKHNKDYIYADFLTEDIEKRCTKIAENILDYFRNIIIKPSPNALERLNIKLENLYRSWGDKHWNIKPNK